MTTTPAPTPDATDHSDHDRAAELYAAECALHAAHQTHDDAWIAAASERLHQAVTDYLTEQTPSHSQNRPAASSAAH